MDSVSGLLYSGISYNIEVNKESCFKIPVWYFLPESPRWLIARGMTEKARALMMKAAKQNGKSIDLSNHVIKTPKVDESAKQPELGFADLFKTKDILIITIVMFFCWPIITMGYYGLGLSMTKLGGNIFVNFILGALVEVTIMVTITFETYLLDPWLPGLYASH